MSARSVSRRSLLQATAVGAAALAVGESAFGSPVQGWLPAPVVYTSYDYGAALDEARNQTSKLVPMKQIGLMLESVPDLAQLDRSATVSASNSSVKTYHLTNPATGAHFYFLRNDTSSTVSGVKLPVTTTAGTLTVPASGGVRLPAKDMKLLATGIKTGHRGLLYSTAQPLYQGTIGARDVAVFSGRNADPVELALPAATAPTVTVLAGRQRHLLCQGDHRRQLRPGGARFLGRNHVHHQRTRRDRGRRQRQPDPGELPWQRPQGVPGRCLRSRPCHRGRDHHRHRKGQRLTVGTATLSGTTAPFVPCSASCN